MSEGTDFLYPFIEGDERDAEPLLRDLAESAQGKDAISRALQRATLDREAASIDAAAAAMAERFAAGGRMFTFGNGGSSTDAASLASLFARPGAGVALAARCLADDTAVITALANDVGFDLVFSRQLIAHAEPGDIALGISTSGNSRNLIVAFDEAARRGLLTVGLAGYDGGEMAASEHVQHCLVVRDDSVHRIQESQAALGFALWRAVQERVAARDVPIGVASHG
jgi:D-sedoheptulose 7-phosphate isomerase